MSDKTSNRREVAAFFSADAPCEVLLEQYQRAYEIRCDELEALQEQLDAQADLIRDLAAEIASYSSNADEDCGDPGCLDCAYDRKLKALLARAKDRGTPESGGLEVEPGAEDGQGFPASFPAPGPAAP